MGTSRDYKLIFIPVMKFLNSVSDKEKAVLKAARKEIERRGKGVKAGLQLRACLPSLEKRLNDFCLTVYPDTPKECYKLVKHVGKVIWGASSAKVCGNCGGKFFGGPAYCTRSCGSTVGCNSEEWLEAHRGDRNAMRTSNGMASYKKALIKKYGVDNLQKSDEVKEKKRRKCLQDYGVEHHAQRADVKKAITRSILKRHGVTNNMQRPEVRAACVKTWNRNWEHGHQLRDPDVFKRVMKSSYSRKTITLLGKTFQVQGYEPAVLKELEPRIQRLTVDPDTMPKIFYQDDTGKKRRYYPDALFQLKSGRNVLLEVKSPYTFSQPKVVQKARATFDLCSTYKDLQYWVAVHSPKGGTAWIKSRKQFDEYLPR